MSPASRLRRGSIPLQLRLRIGAAALTHEPTLRASDPPSWKIGLDWAPAGRERLWLGWEAAKGCGEHTVPPEVPGYKLMVTKAAGGLPPTSAGTSLILAEKHQGSYQGERPR